MKFGKKIILLGFVAFNLQGCLMVAPLLTGAVLTGGSMMATNAAGDSAMSYTNRVQGMSCSQVRQEYERLGSGALNRLSPTYSANRMALLDRANRLGCRIDT